MSGKTKAELLAENAALRAENKRLERKIEILTQNVRGFLYDSDRAERDLRIVKAAHDGTIKDFIAKHNEAGGLLVAKCDLEDTNKRRGGSSYQQYKPVHALAYRYFRMKCRHDPDYFAGKAAGEVREHCLEHRDRFKHVPAQKTIKANLKASA